MKLIDVTNSYSTLVSRQLENTDAIYVKVYSLGKTLVLHSIANAHIEVVLVNKTREVKEAEVKYVLKELMDRDSTDPDLNFTRTEGVVEISITPTPNVEEE